MKGTNKSIETKKIKQCAEDRVYLMQISTDKWWCGRVG
jgi:hypothetical protein